MKHNRVLINMGLVGICLSFLPYPALAENPSFLNSLDPSKLAYCKQERDQRAKEKIAEFQQSSSFGVGGSYGGFGVNTNVSDSISSGRSERSNSQSESIDCDTLIKTIGQVTIAELESNTALAIERMRQESYKYGEDIRLAIANVNLEGVRDTNKTQQNIAGINGRTSVTTTAIQAGTDLLGRLVSPPSRGQEAEAKAQVEIARIQAQAAVDLEKMRMEREHQTNSDSSNQTIARANLDPYISIINSWGETPVNCNAGIALVRIAFETNKVYCIVPTPEVQPGDYAYDQTTGSIFPLNAYQPPSYNPAPVYTPAPVYSQPTDGGGF
jgi:hypothetical protein